MTLTRFSGAKSLCDPLVSQLLGEWVASSPWAKAWWYEATEVAQLPLIRNKQIEAVKQYASVLFPAPELIGLLMDLNVPKGGFRHALEFMTHGGDVSSVPVRDPPPPPPGPLSYQGAMATGHTYGDAEGAREFCPLYWGTPRMQGLGSISAHLRAPKKAGVR